MKVYKHGTKIITKIGQIEAIITEISLRMGCIYYQISYFSHGNYQTAWLMEFEFDICPTKKKAGFGNIIEEENNQLKIEIL